MGIEKFFSVFYYIPTIWTTVISDDDIPGMFSFLCHNFDLNPFSQKGRETIFGENFYVWDDSDVFPGHIHLPRAFRIQ